jgi:hypothetical protein
MSGRRTKALRRAFKAKHGRAPRPSVMTHGPALGPNFTLDAKGNKRPWRDVVKIAASRFKRLILPTATTPHPPDAEKHHARGKGKRKPLGASEVAEMFIRKVYSVKVTEPSEWRRWKKQHRARA